MSLSAIPSAGLQLHGITARDGDPKHHPNSAILFKLSDDLLEDVKKSSHSPNGLQLVTGSTPQIRLGKRTIDLTITPEAFRHELYAATTESLADLDLAGVVGHRAELKAPERKQSVGTDAALAALQNSLASYKQEKEAKSVNISDKVMKEHRNRWEAAREQKQAHRRGLLGSQPASPSMGASSAPRRAAPTSMPASDDAARTQAMRTALIHLMAMRPLTKDEMTDKTHIPKDDLDGILQKVGKPDQGKWQLSDRAYKELDVWKFGYSTKDDRQAAIDNAIRAFDRMRLGKDEKIWQMLLPKEDRDKGIVLSKLHLGAGAASRTPNLAGSPMPQGDGTGDSKMGSATNSPRLGATSTPKVGAKSDAYAKRLFAKDPKKARAAEEAKEKKRKEREAAAAASDKEGGKPARKKQTTTANKPKVLSAEIVQDSSDEDEGEVKDSGSSLPSSQTKPASNERKPASNAAAKPKAKPAESASRDAPAKTTKPKATTSATPKTANTPKTSTPSTVSKSNTSTSKASRPPPLGKSTPNGLSAPSSQHKSQLSPQKADSRPTVPSPLGAARPRVASDVSDRGAVGVQRVKHGAETPKGLGITNGFRKRQDTVTSNESHASSHPEKMPRKNQTTANGTPRPSQANGVNHKSESSLKRKAVDSPSQPRENGVAAKHRKVESSSSSQSRKSHSSEDTRLERSTSSDSASSIINDINYSQGVNIAQKFREVYYPQYAKLYDEQAAMERRGERVPAEERQRLWEMHRRLEQMKREIRAASAREHMEET